MAENSIKKGISDAVAHGFLTVEVDARDLGRIRKFYAPRMRVPVPADDGIHARPVQDQFPIPGGQSLTPDPRIVPLSRQSVTRVGQSMIPRPPDADPRTGTTPHGNTYGKHAETDNMLALPSKQLGYAQGITPQVVVDTGKEVGGEQENLPTPLQDRRHSVSPSQENSAHRNLEARLVDQGIAPVRAAALVRRVPAERIERQLTWIDRRRFRNRAATLIRAIEDDFAPPAGNRPPEGSTASFDPGKFYRGAYAVCPECGARPCAADCPGRRDPRFPEGVYLAGASLPGSPAGQ